MNSTSATTEPGFTRWCGVICALLAFASVVEAQEATGERTEAPDDCLRDAIEVHVREQFAKYGPLSKVREYFGFIFLFKGEISSAIARGGSCQGSCGVMTAAAAAQIPSVAKPLGEWHTHPRDSGGGTLSPEDVRGAYDNRRIRCYTAYYSQPDGDIYAWDPQQSLVPGAMASRVHIGNYRHDAVLAQSDAVQTTNTTQATLTHDDAREMRMDLAKPIGQSGRTRLQDDR